MIAIHGDDKGLVLPPKVAPAQVVIVPIFDSKNKKMVLDEAKKFEEKIKKEFRTKLDDREEFSPGWKYHEWELKGVPVRIEIGPKDVRNKQVVLVRRDTGKKEVVKVGKAAEKIKSLLNEIHKNIFDKANDFLKKNMYEVKTYDELKYILKTKGGILQAGWCGERACEDRLKDETGAKIINIPFKQGKIFPDCIICGKKAKAIVNIAKSY
jgi:prolyl-tRNA synthetase